MKFKVGDVIRQRALPKGFMPLRVIVAISGELIATVKIGKEYLNQFPEWGNSDWFKFELIETLKHKKQSVTAIEYAKLKKKLKDEI